MWTDGGIKWNEEGGKTIPFTTLMKLNDAFIPSLCPCILARTVFTRWEREGISGGRAPFIELEVLSCRRIALWVNDGQSLGRCGWVTNLFIVGKLHIALHSEVETFYENEKRIWMDWLASKQSNPQLSLSLRIFCAVSQSPWWGCNRGGVCNKNEYGVSNKT